MLHTTANPWSLVIGFVQKFSGQALMTVVGQRQPSTNHMSTKASKYNSEMNSEIISEHWSSPNLSPNSSLKLHFHAFVHVTSTTHLTLYH